MNCRRCFTPLFFLLILIFQLAAGIAPVCADGTIVVQLKVFPADYQLYIDGSQDAAETFPLPEKRLGIRVSPGRHLFRFTAEGYLEKSEFVRCSRNNMLYEEKLEKKASPFALLRRVKTGIRPKSVEFTPDGKYMVTALLEDRGIQVFETDNFTEIEVEPVPEEYARAQGFVEFDFVESRKEMWVSQMTTGRVHIYDYTDFRYKGSIDIQGNWSKVIAISPR